MSAAAPSREVVTDASPPRPERGVPHLDLLRVVRTLGPPVIVVVAAVVFPVVIESQELIYLGVLAMIYAALAYSHDAIYSTVGLLPMAQALAWGAGAYTGALLMIHTELPYLLCAAAGGVAGATCNALVVLPSLRLRGGYYLILTFAAAQMAVVVVTNLNLDQLGGGSGLIVGDVPRILGQDFLTTTQLLRLAAAFLVFVMVVVFALRASRLGRAMVAVRENESVARSLGLRPWRFLLAAFTISGFLAGTLGLVYANLSLILEPKLFGAWSSVEIALVLLIGGAGTRIGPLVGAAVIVFLPEMLGLEPSATQIVYGLLLIAIMLFMPRGIMGGPGQGWRASSTAVRARLSRGAGGRGA